MKALEFTIYEIVGYVIPGALTLLGISIISWSAVGAGPVDIDSISVVGWWCAALVAYVIGHVTHAVANSLLRWRKDTVDLVLRPNSPLSAGPEAIAAGEKLAKKLLMMETSTYLAPSTVFAVCDVFLQQKGVTASRDIFVYREGFYRGLVVSSGLLCVAFLLRMASSQSALIIQKQPVSFTQAHFAVLALLAAATAFFAWQRFRRFGRYLITNSILAAVILDLPVPPRDPVRESEA